MDNFIDDRLNRIESRLLSIEQVCNGFRCRERVIGGIAIFLFGVVTTQLSGFIDRRDNMIKIESKLERLTERQDNFNKRFDTVEQRILSISKRFDLSKIEMKP